MEVKIESKTGSLMGPQERIYRFMSDFSNYRHFIPPDKAAGFQATADECSFEMDGLGRMGLRMIEKTPSHTIKITGVDSKLDFFFWIQLKETGANDTKIRLTFKSDMNVMLKTMAEKPIQKFLDSLVEQLGKIPF